MSDIREKLIKILSVPIYPHLDADPAEVVADYLIANGVTVQEWIPVSERLPRSYMDVITLRQDLLSGANSTGLEYITIQRLDDIPEWSKDHMTWKNKVTHWMPLPEPPKGE